MKAYEGEEIKLHPFLHSALDGEWLTSCPYSFTPRKERRYPLNRRVAGLQCRSGPYGEDKNILPLPRIEPRPHVVSKISLDGAVCSVSRTHLWITQGELYLCSTNSSFILKQWDTVILQWNTAILQAMEHCNITSNGTLQYYKQWNTEILQAMEHCNITSKLPHTTLMKTSRWTAKKVYTNISQA
jgi:hypothetical protein